MFRPRGNVNFSRKPSIDPIIGNELSKLAKAMPLISYGDQFPGRNATFGDMHFYTGDDTTSYKKNNWYIRPVDPNSNWQSMNATSVIAENIQAGTIGAGVKVTDSLQLLGGDMLGIINFFKDQKFPAAKIGPGTIPDSVQLAGYVPATGGIYTGNIDMSDHYISSIQKLYGYDNLIFIDMSADGILSMGSDVRATITSALIELIGATTITGNLAISGDLQVNGTDIGIAADTDLIKLAADLLTVNGALTATGNLTIGSGAAGVDYQIKIDGETNDGIINFMEDENYFHFLNSILFSDSVAMKFGTGVDMSILYDGAIGKISTALVAPSDLEVDCGADKTIVLKETVWDDMLPYSINPGVGVSGMSLANYGATGFRWYFWDDNGAANEEIQCFFQLPHSYKEGTDVSLHLHVVPEVNGAGGDEDVEFSLEYQWVNITGGYSSAANTVVASTVFRVGAADAGKHILWDFAHFSGAGKTVSSELMVRIKRLTKVADRVNDDYTAKVYLRFIDVHLEKDTIGSRTETSK